MTILAPIVAVSPLRQRLIDEMDLRRFGHETQRNYIRDVGQFATFLGRSPDTATAENVRCFQIEQCDLGVRQTAVCWPRDSARLVEAMARISSIRGTPKTIRVDNGPEFISKALDRWAYENGVTLERFSPELNQRGFTRPWFSDSRSVLAKEAGMDGSSFIA